MVTSDAAFDAAVIGGGIVGLATARALSERQPQARLIVLEKEDAVARHQSGRNSGVIHSGIYYEPGSLKARFAVEGNRRTVEYCRQHGIPYELCEKVIVAAEEEEVPRLRHLQRQGEANGLALECLDRNKLRRLEPAIDGIAAVRVSSSGITDYGEVARSIARTLDSRGVTIRLGARVEEMYLGARAVQLQTSVGAIRAGLVINCAGLYSDRIARKLDVESDVRIVPFRGEYFQLRRDKRSLVTRLVYPVPDPRLPFLGVHLTPSVDGGLHAGPNAVLALSREGYCWRDISPRDAADTFSYPGFWKLAAQHWRAGLSEVARSGSRRRFARSLQRLVPEVEASDLVPASAGVRAQAVNSDGELVHDFVIVEGSMSVHVLNAPSPAATAAFPIGEAVAARAFGSSATTDAAAMSSTDRRDLSANHTGGSQ